MMSFDLSRMEGEELCHDRCMGLLLTGYVQGIGAAKPNARARCTSIVLKCEV